MQPAALAPAAPALGGTAPARHALDAAPAGVGVESDGFAAAARLVDTMLERGTKRCALRVAAAHPGRVLAAAKLLRSLPILELELSNSPAGQEISGWLQQRDLGFRTHAFAQAVLPVPGEIEDYLRGRGRQGLRNQLSKARRLEITAELVDGATGVDAYVDVSARRRDARPDEGGSVEANQTWVVARTEDGVAQAVICAVVDDDVAILKACRAVHDSALSSPARHAAHHRLLTHLSGLGVRHLLGESALRATPGNRQYQHRLGYHAWNLRPVQASRS